MKSLMLLWKIMAYEMAMRCCTSTTMDYKTVQARVKHEGLSFLTITLPAFGKDFERSLDQGQVDRNLFQGFSWKGGLPKFLWGFLDRVFDRRCGELLTDPDIDAVLAVRQLTLLFSKIELPCSDARVSSAMKGYVECEQEVRDADRSWSDRDRSDFGRISSLLFASLFTDIDRKVYEGDLVPEHGPGATADGLRGNAKYRQDTWPARLDKYFPIGEYLLPNYSFWEQLERVRLLEPGSEMPVKVITVPKTLKTPRIIAEEPTAMMYAQKALQYEFYRGVESRKTLRSMIGFLDQTPNQHLARIGSLSGNFATLDLSEASDRVSNQHVRELLRNHPHLHGAVDACRSRKADVPGHGVIRLAKFASMGSALCFPMEAMVFLTCVFMGIERKLNASGELNSLLSSRDVKRLCSRVRVFGDDIIVPKDYVHSVVRVLQTFGFVVNRSKSFWNGKFRESCGKEYFDGVDVSIVKLRAMFPTHRRHATEVMRIISFRNQLYWAGMWKTCAWLDDYIRGIIKHYPVVEPSSPVHGRESVLSWEAERIHADHQVPLVKGYVDHSIIPKDLLEDHGALLKFFLKRGSLPTADRKHLERAGRPRAVNIKPRWARPY